MTESTTTPAPEPQCPPLPDHALETWLYCDSLPLAERITDAFDTGYRDGFAAAQRLAAEERQGEADAWPEPITDRPPTEADADEYGTVQVRREGAWELWRLSAYFSRGYNPPWHHTPRWRPLAPTKREQAIKALRKAPRDHTYGVNFSKVDDETMALVIEALKEV